MKTKKHYRYRIYTENRLSSIVAKMVGRYFGGFSVIYGTGVWQNKVEKCMIIEIVTECSERCKIGAICYRINKLNHQKCCMVTIEEVQAVFI